MRFPYGIDEDGFLLFNQVRVLARSIINAVIRAVEFFCNSQSILPTQDTLFLYAFS